MRDDDGGGAGRGDDSGDSDVGDMTMELTNKNNPFFFFFFRLEIGSRLQHVLCSTTYI